MTNSSILRVEMGLTEWLHSHWIDEMPTFNLNPFEEQMDKDYTSFFKDLKFPGEIGALLR